MDPENKGRVEHVLIHRLFIWVKGLAPGCAGQPHRLGVPQRLAYRAELHHDSRRDEEGGSAWAEEVSGEACEGLYSMASPSSLLVPTFFLSSGVCQMNNGITLLNVCVT